jgi:hypothetical protein
LELEGQPKTFAEWLKQPQGRSLLAPKRLTGRLLPPASGSPS